MEGADWVLWGTLAVAGKYEAGEMNVWAGWSASDSQNREAWTLHQFLYRLNHTLAQSH